MTILFSILASLDHVLFLLQIFRAKYRQSADFRDRIAVLHSGLFAYLHDLPTLPLTEDTLMIFHLMFM